MTREIDDYENEIEDLHNRLDIAEYDKERLREEVTNLEEKIRALEQEPCDDCISRVEVNAVIDKWIRDNKLHYIIPKELNRLYGLLDNIGGAE